MAYRVLAPVANEPVTLAEARLHLRLPADQTAEDDLITAWIGVAREYAETYTRRALAPQTLEMALDRFPGSPSFGPWNARGLRQPHENGAFDLEMPPIASVTSIKYTDPDGLEQTLDPSKYARSPYGPGVKVYPTYGNPWPATQPTPDAVRIQYDTGYGRDGGPALPRAAKSAILLIVGHLFENRQDVYAIDGRLMLGTLPNGADALLDTIKLYGL